MEEERMTWNDEIKNISISTLFVFTLKVLVVNIIWVILFFVVMAACMSSIVGAF